MQNWMDLDTMIDRCLLTVAKTMTAGVHKLASLKGPLESNHCDASLPGRTKGKKFTTILIIYKQREAKYKPVSSKGRHVELGPAVWSGKYRRALSWKAFDDGT